MKIRGTVSMLCAQHLRPGREHLGQQLRVAVEVGDQQLHAAAGVAARGSCGRSRAYSQAPPSGRSSRATPVTVAYRRPMVATDSATRRGSPRSNRPACRWRSGRSRSAGCTGRRRSGTWPPGPPSTRRCWGSRPPGTPCAGPRVSPGLAARCTRAHLRPDLDPRRLLLNRGSAVAGFDPEAGGGPRERCHSRPSFVSCGACPPTWLMRRRDWGDGHPAILR